MFSVLRFINPLKRIFSAIDAIDACVYIFDDMTTVPISLDFSRRFGAEEVFNPLGFLQLVLICRVRVWYVFDFMGTKL